MHQNEKPVWLILSHAFNMDGRAASQTITDKIPHLLALGIEPIVISAVTGKKDAVIEHHQVFPAGPVALRFDLRHYLKQRISSRVAYRVAMAFISLLLLPFYVVEKLFVRIETHWSWAVTAYVAGAAIIRQRKPVVIYSTGGAYSAHLAGYWLARKSGLPWVVEIHDPMVIGQPSHPNARQRFLASLEKKICANADIVWWFTERALERAQTRHPELGKRGHCIIPGADAPDVPRTPYQRSAQLVIGHFGSLAETRNLETFLQGLDKTLAKHPEWKNHFSLHLYGGGIDPISARAMRAFPYPELIHQFGRLEKDPVTGESGRSQVIRRMNAADCLLLLHGTDDWCEEYIPSKMYEYLWTERPVLALVWRNPQMTRMLQELGHWAIKADDPEAISNALEELHERWTRDALLDSGMPSPYTSEASTRQIVSLVQQLPSRS